MSYFTPDEYTTRRNRLSAKMEAEGLDALLLFAPESQYWLTGYDTFGFCFFQCLIYTDGRTYLLTRSADMRQAQLTSNVGEIRVWVDGIDAPAAKLADWVAELGLTGKRIGYETDTAGLTAMRGREVDAALPGLVECNGLVDRLRLTKSEAEIAAVRRATELGDIAYETALPLIRPGNSEGVILDAMQGAVFANGGDYPGNPFIIGSGERALLCRYTTGRRTLQAQDQLTLEWAGVEAQYHGALMKTVVIGEPTAHHVKMHAAAHEALLACEDAMRPGNIMRDVYDAHVRVMADHDLDAHRLNACGYSMGASYAPCWMDTHMFHAGAMTEMEAGMTFFLHMILMDSESGTAMTLGRTSLITANGAEPLSRLSLELPCVG
ncbi:M24 family metallopeptidase [Pontivivens insulae]|uniref:Ectoine hydrolase n=1 Tax=Pontivivens insulae TaxID=1639689 RepID=A0A2R8AEL5_9RHOB|nr:Xaa-Pro peptidase family protein [Pontivivens insulae]RED14403.1 Xaa-Pro dipeptidase [Pontivivens insulae]SPF30480.1 Ectoine hydrolase [Pontivivens insulae]